MDNTRINIIFSTKKKKKEFNAYLFIVYKYYQSSELEDKRDQKTINLNNPVQWNVK